MEMNNRNLVIDKNLEVDGCKIFNPIEGKIPEIIEYFVGFYGEQYREQIENKINNTAFFFLPKKEDCKSLVSTFAFSHNLGSGIRLLQTFENLEFDPNFFDEKDRNYITVAKSTEGQNFYKKYKTIATLNDDFQKALNPIDISKIDKKIEIVFDDKIKEIFKADSELSESGIAQYSQTLQTIFFQREVLKFDNLPEFIQSDLETIVQKWLKNNPDTKYSKCKSVQECIDGGLLKKIFTPKLCKSVAQLEKEKEKSVNQNHKQDAGLDILGRLKQLKVGSSSLIYHEIIHYLHYKSEAEAFEISDINDKDQLINIIVSKSGLFLNIPTFVHEMNHAIDSSLASIDKKRVTLKCGFTKETGYRNKIRNLFNVLVSSAQDSEKDKKITALNESCNDYIAVKIADKMKKDGFEIGLISSYKYNDSSYSKTFEILSDFYDKNMDVLIEARMSTDSESMTKILGQEGFDQLADLTYAYMYPYEQAKQGSSAYEGKTDREIRQIISQKFDSLRPKLEEKIDLYRKSKTTQPGARVEKLSMQEIKNEMRPNNAGSEEINKSNQRLENPHQIGREELKQSFADVSIENVMAATKSLKELEEMQKNASGLKLDGE